VISRLREIAHLSPDELTRRLDAVVAYFSPNWPILFIRDGSFGRYVPADVDLDLQTGDTIAIEGVINTSRFIADYTIRPSQHQIRLPEPAKVEYQQLQEGAQDSQYVELTAWVVGVDREHGHYTLETYVGSKQTFPARAPHDMTRNEIGDKWFRKKVTLRGIVGGRYSNTGQFIGFQIWI